MTIYEIGLLMVGWFATVVLFYSMGVDAGYRSLRQAAVDPLSLNLLIAIL